MSPKTSLGTIFAAFLRLGCISFGGPIAHLGYLREEFVNRRRWLDDETYSDLVALCQFLPGPTSSQIVFALGMQRAGILGALLASLCFTLPSALLMIFFAYGITTISDLQKAGWLHGLKLAAVVMVAQAVWEMGKKLCPDSTRILIALIVASILLIVPGPSTQIGIMIAGALLGYWFYRNSTIKQSTQNMVIRHSPWAIAALLTFFSLLLILPILAATTGNFFIRQFDSFYRAGSLVFGGGHIVLPLLRAEVIPPGWINTSEFIAGYGAAQALPGPLFTFAAYLGTIINNGSHAWLGGVWCLFAIFLPTWLLVAGCFPFWNLIRSKSWARAALMGANAAVVGLLLAALYNPVWKQSITGIKDIVAVVVIFTLLTVWKFPPWAIVLLSAIAGQWLL